MKVLRAAETFLCPSASCFSFVPPFSALFHSLYFLLSNFTAVSPLYGPSGVSLATRSTVLRSLGRCFYLQRKKAARTRAELTEPSRDRRERAQRLSRYFFGSVSVRVARTGSSSRDNSEGEKERGSSRWWQGGGGGSMPRGALFCPLWRPPACPPRIPADRSEY